MSILGLEIITFIIEFISPRNPFGNESSSVWKEIIIWLLSVDTTYGALAFDKL